MTTHQELLNKSAFFKYINPNVPFPTKLNNTVQSEKEQIKLNIGSGPNFFVGPGWENLDREDLSQYINHLKHAPFDGMPEQQVELAKKVRQHGLNFKVHDLTKGFEEFKSNSVSLIVAGQLVEHLPPRNQLPQFLKECYRMLKPGGILRITTPDLDLLIQAYLKGEMSKFSADQPDWYQDLTPSAQLAMIMYGTGGEESSFRYFGHMFLFTKESMVATLLEAGFSNIKFFYKAGESQNPILSAEVVDEGMSHSMICESMK